MRHLFSLILITVLVSVIGVISAPSPIYALESESQCRPIEAVFARGSGQSVGKSGESKRFANQIENAVSETSVGYHFYELGTEKYNESQYQAVDVADIWNGNALGAKFSSGMSNDYGRSVKGGVSELKEYLTLRYKKCGSQSFYLLGGYSQGAQVVGQTLPELSADIQRQIAFVSLFGDPKLNLPEGRGFNPPACQGKELSPWRRVIGNCKVDNGSLGARQPYLPDNMTDKTGLWCYAKDFVCGSSKNPLTTSGHMLYGNEGEAVDQAVAEGIKRLKKILPEDQAQALIDKPTNQVIAGPDVVFMIDTTGSMSNQIYQAVQFARDSADKIRQLNGRVALVAYRDAGDSYTAKIISPFSTDLTKFQAGLDTLYADGGGDEPEALLHALMTAFNGLEWRDGVAKATIVLTDATYHNPDRVDGTTLDMVVRRSLEIDPVNIYPVVPSWVEGYYREIAEKTAGQVVVDNSGTAGALVETISKIKNRADARLKLTGYSAEVGQSITFDASDSSIEEGEIVQYDWDFNGDGIFDQTTDSAIVEHVYSEQFDGFMQVRLVGSNGTVASVSATVQIGLKSTPATPQAPKNLQTKITSTKDNLSMVEVSWEAVDNLAKEWVISVDGIAVGRSAGSVTKIELTDVVRDRDVVVAVAGVSEEFEIGDSSEVVIAKLSIPENPDKPAKLSWFELLMWIIRQIVKSWAI